MDGCPRKYPGTFVVLEFHNNLKYLNTEHEAGDEAYLCNHQAFQHWLKYLKSRERTKREEVKRHHPTAPLECRPSAADA